MEQPASEHSAQTPEGQNPAPTIPATAPAPASSAAPTAPLKPVHSLVLDANAIIQNEPPVSTLLSQAEVLYTIPAVVSESMPTSSGGLSCLSANPCPSSR